MPRNALGLTSLAARWIVWLIGVSVVACAAPTLPTTPPLATITAGSPAATPIPNATATRVLPTRTPIIPTSAITLTLWTTEDLAPGTTPAGKILRNQYDAFTAANPNIHIDIVLKKPYGKGGLLDFLQTTSAVAPSQLPDLATLDISELPPAAETGALQSFDTWLPADLNNDFFPFASKAARYQNQWLAVPFAADLSHGVYNKTVVKKAPLTWDELVKAKSPFLLPLGGNEAFWLQYAALVSANDSGAPLDPKAIAEVLTFFKRARDLGLLSDTAIGLKDAEVWSAFVAGQVPLAQVSASRFMTERDKAPNAQFAPVPTRDGKIATVASGWAFVMTTSDPLRQAAATRFAQWITQGERLAPWLRAAHRLPTTRSTIVLAVDPPDYAAFLRDELERAAYLPPSTTYLKASDAWRAAITNVWKGQLTPEEAARTIVAASK